MQVPLRNQHDVPRLVTIIRDNVRHIDHDVLPRAQRRIEHSLTSISNSIGRELETTQRLLDPDDDSAPVERGESGNTLVNFR